MTGFTVAHNWFLNKYLNNEKVFISAAYNTTYFEFFGDLRQIVKKILDFF